MQLNTIQHCDWFELLQSLPDNSIDAIISDPPYNTTSLSFEQLIDWYKFWIQARRVLKSKISPTILFSQQPFTTDLIISNRTGWRYEIIWEKSHAMGYLDANRKPLRAHENIQVFGDGLPEYIPQMEYSIIKRHSVKDEMKPADHYGKHKKVSWTDDGSRFPRSVWKFAQRDSAFKNTVKSHPTQKPLKLLERLILTFTHEGWVILDPFAGSGTTGEAARNLNRHYIMGDNDGKWVQSALKRLSKPYTIAFPELR